MARRATFFCTTASGIDGNVNRAIAAGALRSADRETCALIVDSVIRNRNDGEYLQRVINDAEKIDYFRGKISEAIATLGARGDHP